MHHHQDESGMNEEKGKERDGVARRHGVTEIMKLAGNVAKGQSVSGTYDFYQL